MDLISVIGFICIKYVCSCLTRNQAFYKAIENLPRHREVRAPCSIVMETGLMPKRYAAEVFTCGMLYVVALDGRVLTSY